MPRLFTLLLAGIAAIYSCGCNIINPPEVVPTYVQIDSFSFSGDVMKTGSNSHKITNIYVYFNNAPVGIFDLPVKFPVIARDSGTLTVIAGIDYDGLHGYEVIYPLYSSDKLHLVPSPGAVIHYTPKIGYNSSAKLALNANFETGSGTRNTGFDFLSGDTSIVTTSNAAEIFEGAGSGAFYLPAGKDSAVVVSGPVQGLTSGQDAYIELDYRGNSSLTVGMSSLLNTTGNVSSELLIALRPRATWGKIYIGITEFIEGHQGTDYRVLLRADKTPGLTDGNVFVDNVKVVAF